ncbi:MAG: flagellar hook-associated protein FlgL [Gammaproteobacteria bacterium]
MRISTQQFYNQGARAIMNRQSEVARTQAQLSSGHRLLDASDDPAASARLLKVREQIAATEQFQRNIALANGRLGVEESALSESENVLQRARELTVQGNNGTLSDRDRASIAIEIRQLRAQLLDLGNTRDGSGEFLFAGSRTQTQPFADGGTSVNYQGDQSQRLVQVGPQRQVEVGDSGAEVFMQIPTGNGRFSVSANSANTGTGNIAIGSVTDPAAFQYHDYRIEFTAANTFDVIDETTSTTLLAGQTYSDGQAIQFAGIQTAISGVAAAGDRFNIQSGVKRDVFTVLDDIASALETATVTPAQTTQLHQTLSTGLANLDQGLDHLLEIRGKVGARFNTLQAQEQTNTDFTLYMEKIGDDLDGLNYVDAASRLNQELETLQAAQQSYMKIQNLSLFEYLR